jgi:hypothetical protein
VLIIHDPDSIQKIKAVTTIKIIIHIDQVSFSDEVHGSPFSLIFYTPLPSSNTIVQRLLKAFYFALIVTLLAYSYTIVYHF